MKIGMQLMWHQVHRQPIMPEAISHLQTALLMELIRIAQSEETIREQTATRQDKMLRRFLYLINPRSSPSSSSTRRA